MFLCELYESKLQHTADAVWEHMLLRRSKPESMPPTSDALRFYLMRAFYQFIVWRSAAITEPDRSFFLKDGELPTLTMPKDATPKAKVEIISCQCNSGCGTKRIRLRCRPTRLCHKLHSPGVCVNSVGHKSYTR